MSRLEALRAELAVAELEEALAVAKRDGTLTRELKQELFAARKAYRENHRDIVNAIEEEAV